MHAPLRYSQLIVLAFVLTACHPADSSAPSLPASPVEAPAIKPTPEAVTGPALVPAGLNLIIDQEVSDQATYDKLYIHPTDGGGGDSGVTTGIGYDYSAVSRSRSLTDWEALPQSDNNRLASTAGLSGSPARARLPGLRDISVPWSIAVDEFQVVDVPRYWQECEQAFPGFDDLRPNAQGAILSVVYNRGSSTVGPSRVDFRTLRTAIANQDYDAMAAAVRHMLVTMRSAWQSAGIYEDMVGRRNAEADLILTP